MGIYELETSRLNIRQWQNKDFPAFATLNSDKEVMEYFPSTLSTEESNNMARKCQQLIAEKGWGFWVLELKQTKEFIGFLGLHEPQVDLPFLPCVEIGWRLSKEHWGKGYATEAAREVIKLAFETIKLDEIVSFTTITNTRSRALMQRLGFKNTNQNFQHPSVASTHPLSEHVLYKLCRLEWLNCRQ